MTTVSSLRLAAAGVLYPVLHTLWIPDAWVETCWGPLYVMAVFLLGWWMVGHLEEKRIVLIVGASGCLVTWTVCGLSGVFR
jgi:hypothetical protein